MDTLYRSSPIRRAERPPGLRTVAFTLEVFRVRKPPSVHSAVSTGFYWVGQKSHSDFSVRSYGKTWMNFLTNPITKGSQLLMVCSMTPGPFLPSFKIIEAKVPNPEQFNSQRDS